jgi:hypothetical protein
MPRTNSVDEAIAATRNILRRAARDLPVTTSLASSDADVEAFFDDSDNNVVMDNPFDSYDSERMVEEMPYVSVSDFPSHELPKWDMSERDIAANAWSRQMDYRLRWIFYRDEREGVNRTRYIQPFSPDDFKHRVEKTSEPHPKNTETSTFYDWKIGGADFLMRLEQMVIKNSECLRCHFIYKPTGKELCYQDRVWDGSVYSEFNMKWADS